MDNFPTKRHYLLIAFLWVPAQLRNLADPTLDWVALIVAAIVGLFVAYMMVFLLTAGVRKSLQAARSVRHREADA